MSIKNRPPRRRFRYSIRTLLVLVALVIAYLACWEPTKKWGEKDVARHAQTIKPAQTTFAAALPLIVRRHNGNVGAVGENYYFWFFGYVAKLPFEG